MVKLKVRKFNYSLEGLRGVCALTVALAHVQTGMILFPSSVQVLIFSHFAHLAVLVFFMLSGYVIGVNYPTEQFNKKDYLVKRLFRIYPIYLIVILFCFMIEPDLNLSKVLGSLFLFQGWTQRLATNVVLWSIHYEILFYLLFIFVSKKSRIILMQALVCIALSLVVWATPQIPQIFGGYFCGFAFWLTGLYISKMNTAETTSKQALLCLFFLVMVYNNLVPGGIILNKAGLKTPAGIDLVSAADIFNMIPCFLIIVVAGNVYITKKWLNGLYLLAIGLPALILALLVYTGRLREEVRWEMSLVFLIISIVFYFFKQRDQVLKSIAFLGGISYSIYIVHWPIGYFLGRFSSPQQWWFKIILFIFWLALVVTISWLLEKKLQYFLKKKFFPSKKQIPASALH